MEDKIIDILKRISGLENISDENLLKDDIGLDSFGAVSLLLELEDGFEIEFDESDMDYSSLKNVSDIYRLVKKYTGESYEKLS